MCGGGFRVIGRQKILQQGVHVVVTHLKRTCTFLCSGCSSGGVLTLWRISCGQGVLGVNAQRVIRHVCVEELAHTLICFVVELQYSAFGCLRLVREPIVTLWLRLGLLFSTAISCCLL